MKRKYVMRWLLAASIMLYAATALAQNLTLTGPKESLAGDLVVLSVGASGEGREEGAGDEGLGASVQLQSLTPSPCSLPSTPSPLAPIPCVWSVTPPELVEGKYRVCDDGKTVVFASRLPGTYYFTAAAVVDGKPEIVTHRLDNIAMTPGPTPLPPVPEPDPQPKPDPATEITALKQYAATKATELVKSQYFDRERKALAESFLTTAKQIEEGELDTPEKARTKQRDNSRRYLSSVSRNSWQTWQNWDEAVGKQLAEIDAASALTVGQIGQCYKNIGLGLHGTAVSDATPCATGNCPR